MNQEADRLYALGQELAQRRKYREARAAWRHAWELDPQEIAPMLALARLEQAQHGPAQAQLVLAEALQTQPQAARLHLEQGLLFYQLGQLEQAVQAYRQALEQDPELVTAWQNLGLLLQDLGRYEAAQSAYQEALKYDPEHASTHNSLGLLHYQAGEAAPARQHLQRAVQLRPQQAAYHLNLGMAWLLEPLELETALQELQMAILQEPAYAQELMRIGDYFMLREQHHLARPFLELALTGQGDAVALHLKLARCAECECRMQAALDHFQAALHLQPTCWLLEIYAALLLPSMYLSAAEIQSWHSRLQSNLQAMHQLLDRGDLPRLTQRISFYSPVFQLAYQGLNNKALLESLSQLWGRILRLPATQRTAPVRGRQRIGLLSSFFYQHSIAGVYLGLFRELAQRGLELHVFSLGGLQIDSLTHELQASAHWHLLPFEQSLESMAQSVIDADLDLLIYPELGMDSLTYLLAQTRLAPRQALLYGHPSTSGIQSMDYFLSLDCLEAPGAEAHYTETLVRLPGVPFFYAPPPEPLPPFDRQQAGLPPDSHLYLVPGTLFKVHVEMDRLFETILAQDPQAQIVFLHADHKRWHLFLAERLQQRLGEEQMTRIHFWGKLPKAEFFSLLCDADVVLDTLHFTSGNVACQALALGVPMLTCPGQLMRSRITTGLYQIMEIPDCVATSVSDLASRALRMAQDRVWREQLRALLLQRSERWLKDHHQDCVAMADSVLGLLA